MPGKRRGSGEGSIYWIEARKRWAASLSLGFKRRKTFTGKTRAEVKRKLEEAKLQQAQGLLATGPSISLATWLDEWLEGKEPDLRPHTVSAYRTDIRHISKGLGQRKLGSLRPEHIQRFYNELSKNGLSPRTITHIHHVLKMALSRARRWKLIAWNPVEDVDPPRVESVEGTALTAAQVLTLLEELKGHRLYAFYLLLVTTGLRLGEATALRWQDIDLEGGTLSVTRSARRVTGGFEFGPPKTASSRRAIRLSRRTIAALRTHRANQLIERAAARTWLHPEFVFTTPTGQVVGSQTANRILHDALRRHDLPDITIHGLRHTAASLAANAGADMMLVKAMMGHSRLAQTADLYTHVGQDRAQDIAHRMDRLLADLA